MDYVSSMLPAWALSEYFDACMGCIDIFANLGYVSSTLPIWALSEYFDASLGYVDMLPSWTMSPRCFLLGNYQTLWCLLGLYRHVSIMGYVSSMFLAWELSEYCDAWIGYIDMLPSWTMSHRCCLLGHYRNTLMPAWAVSTYLPTWAMSHRHCLFGHCQNTSMPAWAMSTCCHHGLCLLDVSCLGTIGTLRCLLGLYRHVSIMGYVSLMLLAWELSEYCNAWIGYVDMLPTWAMSHRRWPAWALSEHCDAWIGYVDMLPSWAMSHQHCLIGHCRNTSMPAWAILTCCHHGLCLIDVACWGTFGILWCLNRLCRHVAIMGYVSSTLPAWALFEYYDAWIGCVDMLPSWDMSHRHCLIGHCRNTLMPSWAISTCCHHGLCLIDVACLGTVRILWCLLGLCRHVAIMGYVSSMLPAWALSEYFDAWLGGSIIGSHWYVKQQVMLVCRPGYSVSLDMWRVMIVVSFEIDVSVYERARIGDD
jgi:hypothetical protein